VQNDLPRIRYANPRLEIEVDKKPKTREDTWKPELVVELRACTRRLASLSLELTFTFYYQGDGTKKSVKVDGKWSSAIFQEVMELGGGPLWDKWKESRTAAGLPLVEAPAPKPKPAPKAPHYRPGQPTVAAKSGNAPTTAQNPFRTTPEQQFINPGKTGAAAVLP
jgi:small subunit ribosomal protein S25